MAPRVRTQRRARSTPRRAAYQRSSPRTIKPDAEAELLSELDRSTADKIGRTLDAMPDRVDIRDWVYQPALIPLPDQLVNCDLVPFILDQGREGACTGFALAAVINFLLHSRRISRSVSPRMLYEMARRYDEWPGEAYEGSSARGAMKGWVRHGVSTEGAWPADRHGPDNLTPEIAAEAQSTPGGAFYRVSHREVRDMHAALNEVSILYATLMVHEGWFRPGPKTVRVTYVESGEARELELPVIERKGRADGGHAIAIVGYTAQGFIVQNSWGESWGARGFALLPYEDYMLHATDVWAAQLGVPVQVDLWTGGAADSTAGLHRATPAVPLSEIRPYVVDVGNNGELSSSGNYWTTEADLARLFGELIPSTTSGWAKRRVLLYLHGGLNDEPTVARRIVAFRDVLLENQIYPLHVMWETGVFESLNGLIEDLFTDVDERHGRVADWLDDFRSGLLEARDLSFELTAAAPGTVVWDEMKENARLSSQHPDGRGGMQLIAQHARAALEQLEAGGQTGWEVHVVGHSAGCIYSAYAMPMLTQLGERLKSIQLMAPAITTRLFKEAVLPLVNDGRCPRPTAYVLSDEGERGDTVGPYGKSLLYLVSNAFERRRETPLLGMKRFIDRDDELGALFQSEVDGLPSLVVAGESSVPGNISSSETHGSFDNDPDTLNSVLHRILGSPPTRPFTNRDLQF